MPEYPNPAGGSMTASNDADAKSKGWSPSMGTFGSNTYPNGQDGGGGGGGAPKAAGSSDLSGYVAAMQASSGFSIKQLEEQKREFDQTLDWQKEQWRNQGMPELAIKQRAQDLEDAKFAELQRSAKVSEGLAQQAQDLDKQVKLGNLSIAQAQEQLQEFVQKGQLAVSQGQLGVSQGQLGLDTLKTAASLSGPENWIQASNFTRGVQGSNLPGFMQQLLSGQSTAVLGGPQPGQQMSNPLTMTGMAGAMGGLPGQGQSQPGQMQMDVMPNGQPAAQTPEQAMQLRYQQAMQQAQAAQAAQANPQTNLAAQQAQMAAQQQAAAAGQPLQQLGGFQAGGAPAAPAAATPEAQQAAQQAAYQQAVAAYGAANPGAAPAAAGAAPADPAALQQTQNNAYQQSMAAYNAANPGAAAAGAAGGQAAATPQTQQAAYQQSMAAYNAANPGAAQAGAGGQAAATPQAQQAAYQQAVAAYGGAQGQANGSYGAPQWAQNQAQQPQAADGGGTWTGATTADVAKLFGRADAYGQPQQQQGFGQDTTASQNALRRIYSQGGQAYGPQQLEGLTSSERKMFEGGGAAVGADVAGFEEQYQRSRIGQQSAKPSSFSGM